MKNKFIANNSYGQHGSAAEVDRDLDDVDQERIRRQGHGLDNEDQDWRYKNLSEVRGRMN